MKIYLGIDNNRIVNVYTEEIGDGLVAIDVDTIDEFNDQVRNYSVNEEIIESVSELFGENSNIDSLSLFNIKHWVSNRSFGELVDMYENNEIVTPEMQRDFVWDSLKCSRLIESIILGLPIPPLFLLEVDKNQYELIDGKQRLAAILNFIKGYPWSGKHNSKRSVRSRLSKRISKELQGKSFSDLSSEHQRIIKRSTIPLIEFKQLEPDNFSSKYLIFERINTGSVKLNQMQIRKSLAYGNFINSLYLHVSRDNDFRALFSVGNIKMDNHVEAFLRVFVLSKIFYDGYMPKSYGITNILNDFCERNKSEIISDDYISKFKNAFNKARDIFEKADRMFRRVESINGILEFDGNLNVSIMEALLGVLIYEYGEININDITIRQNYLKIMFDTLDKARKTDIENPFSTSTGSESAIRERFMIIRKIMGIEHEYIRI
jgi:hypothetical protein